MRVIESLYFIQFLKFIDLYPTEYISIDLMEKKIIKYSNENDIIYDDYFKQITIRYQLKIMYLDMHIKKLSI